MPTAIESLRERLFDVNALQTAATVMDWDQQTYMPKGASEARAHHMSTLTRMAHEQFTADDTRKWAEDAVAETEDDVAWLRLVRRKLNLATKLPSQLVAEKTHAGAIGHDLWVEARKANDFARFAPQLERLFDICRQEAELYGYQDDIYDALLDTYEEGATAAEVRAMFAAIKQPQIDLIERIKACGPVDDSWLYGNWAQDSQRQITEYYLRAVGYDFERGRQDTAAHPFCTSFSVTDVRVTTRYTNYLPGSIMSTLHEAGHAMYEQGSPVAWDRTLLAGGASLGVHESQSRLWENIVGRSMAFWAWGFGRIVQAFPALAERSATEFQRAINKVEPSLIRVEADELTYNLHIMIRFELESEILKGQLKVADLPAAWNAKYQAYLGITPDSDANGCLQDVHWSGGSVGYFPTYTMGNLLSYQIWNRMRKDVGDTDMRITRGEFAPILQWLREHMYQYGSKFAPKDLVVKVTGKPMDPTEYLDGLQAKYTALYHL
ncbi:MAG: carboxypeptidase M32 [Fimbriimonadaceae bacterium]|nr:carboxypeptidase M32 [Fimbriimonadaceae bacterium]